MADRLLPLAAFVVLLGFLSVLVLYVPRLDLGLVILLTLVAAIYDFFFHDSRRKAAKTSRIS